MSLLPNRQSEGKHAIKLNNVDEWKQLLRDKTKASHRRVKRMSMAALLDYVNAMNIRLGAHKIGSMIGYRDQWMLCMRLLHGDKIQTSFCQGRNVGRITHNGGYTVDLHYKDCEMPDDLDFKFWWDSKNQGEKKETIRDYRRLLDNAIVTGASRTKIRHFARCLVWADYEPAIKEGVPLMADTIEVLREKVNIALKNGATPALKVCEDLRTSSKENSDWLDQTYIENKRPEMVGDDKDGLVSIVKASPWLKKQLEKCKPSEVVYWVSVIKGIIELPDSTKSLVEAEGEQK